MSPWNSLVPRLCDGVDDAAGRAAVLGRVARRVDLKLADGRLADRVADARAAALLGEERLVVVAAVDGVVIQQTRDAAERDEAEGAVGHRAGREDGVVRPAAAVDRQVVDRSLVDVGREVLLLGVDDRSLARHLHGLLRAGEPEVDVDGRDAADFDDDLLLREGGEARGADRHGVVTRVELHDAEASLAVGGGGDFLVGLLVSDGDRGIGHDRALRVLDRAADGTLGRGLRPSGGRAEGEAENEQGQRGG